MPANSSSNERYRPPTSSEVSRDFEVYYDEATGKLVYERPNPATLGQTTVGITADTEPIANSLENRELRTPFEAIAELGEQILNMRDFVIEAEGIPQVSDDGTRLTLSELKARKSPSRNDFELKA